MYIVFLLLLGETERNNDGLYKELVKNNNVPLVLEKFANGKMSPNILIELLI